MAGLLSNLFDPSTYSSNSGGSLLARLPEWAWQDPNVAFPQPQMPLPAGPPAFSAAAPVDQSLDASVPSGSGLADWLGGTSNALIGLGAGIAGGGNLSQSIAKGLQGLMTGRQADQKQAAGNAMMQALMARGLEPQQARLALAHPGLMKAAAARLFPSYRFERTHDLFGAFDPATGGFRPLGLPPK